ncbi:MAG: Hsp33 family molecular chaperone HslO [Lachnospiraceae bacterium]|nr:Hsp33 family molecular chaperone HslO [Lachnospiraceae bacterium]
MKDTLVRAIADNAQIRAFAVRTTDMTETARRAHDTSPVVTAALGRLMSGAAMMGSMLGEEDELLTLKVDGDGDVGGLVVTADGHGSVKGYAKNPQAMCPASAAGKLDVGRIVGRGYLTVIKDMGMEEPYNSRIELVTGEIGDDLAQYFVSSEQIPSGVGLGVLMNKDNTVRCAGGFIIQLMPFASDECVARLEQSLSEIKSVTALLDRGLDPEEMLREILTGVDAQITDRREVAFRCNCTRDRVERVLLSMGRQQLEELASDGEDVELNCQFCNTHYVFSPQEIRELLRVEKTRSV